MTRERPFAVSVILIVLPWVEMFTHHTTQDFPVLNTWGREGIHFVTCIMKASSPRGNCIELERLTYANRRAPCIVFLTSSRCVNWAQMFHKRQLFVIVWKSNLKYLNYVKIDEQNIDSMCLKQRLIMVGCLFWSRMYELGNHRY